MAFRLPRLPRQEEIVEVSRRPTRAYQQWWQSFAKAIETQEDLQDAIIAQVQANQLDIIATQEALALQQDEIEAQLAQILAVTNANAISASWVVPGLILSASDAGTDATITVADFSRFYDDGTSVPVTGAALTGLAYSTTYAVYYDDPTRANGTPIFVATTVLAAARHNYVEGRHYVDTITTPGSGEGDTSGGGYVPPGGGSSGTDLPEPIE